MKFVRLFAIVAVVRVKRHSIAEKEEATSAVWTVLWSAEAPHAYQRQMPQSKPYSDAKRPGSSAETKLFTAIPP